MLYLYCKDKTAVLESTTVGGGSTTFEQVQLCAHDPFARKTILFIVSPKYVLSGGTDMLLLITLEETGIEERPFG